MSGSGTQCGGGGKSICPICFEDLKPAAEDLQSISVCGHVFHELCINKWLGYCPAGKRPTCPVCKQSFPRTSLLRLYFQSFGGPSQLPLSPRPLDADAERLWEDARRLQQKLDAQKTRILELTEEVSKWKERAREEGAAKDGIRREKDRADQVLRDKEKELVVVSAECTRLRERSLDLAKEVAAFKLAMDVNLEEDEIMKVASIGSGMQLTVANEVLKTSLVLCNKNYKKLMVQCSLLGRSESRALKKLEKAEERIKTLKTQLQELEKAFDKKENLILRNLKSSKKDSHGDVLDPVSLRKNTCSFDARHEDCVTENCLKKSTCLGTSDISKMNVTQGFPMEPALVRKRNTDVVDGSMRNACLPFDKNADNSLSDFHKTSARMSGYHNPVTFEKDLLGQQSNHLKQVASATCEETDDQQFNAGEGCAKQRRRSNIEIDLGTREMDSRNLEHFVPAPTIVCIDDDTECGTLIQKSRETPADKITSSSGAPSFSGWLLGSKDGNRHPGKWCGRGQSTVSPTMGSSTSSGSLISVGADGRGGKIKVLRTSNEYPEKFQALLPKRFKSETKQVPPSSGCLQIEHFFGSKGNSQPGAGFHVASGTSK